MDSRSAEARARARGFGGCLLAVLIGGVGLVLTALGLAPATREALPFGVGLVVLGAIFALFGTIALLAARSKSGGDAAVEDLGAGAVRPPTTVACHSCGAPAPVRVNDPTHASCPFCHARFALPADLAARLQAAAQLLSQQNASERQIADSITRLAARQRGWVLRVGALAVVLGGIALLSAAFGWFVRYERSEWHAIVTFGVVAMLSTVTLAALGMLIVPPWMRRIVGRWAAVRLPGVDGLACRECGGALPAEAAPVLRCGYCAADNVAGAHVIGQLARGAAQASKSALAVAERRNQSEELAARGMLAFPLLVLLSWFAVGAASGSAVMALAHDVRLDPDSDARFAVLRTSASPSPCLAALSHADGQAIVDLRAGSRHVLSKAAIASYSVQPPLAPAALVGRRLTNGYGDHRVASVYRRLNFFASHVAVMSDGTEVYLPWPDGGGELTCLDDVEAGSGPSLQTGAP